MSPNQNVLEINKSECNPVILFINEENISKSPQIVIKFEDKVAATAMLDSGSEVNLISQNKFDQLQKAGMNALTLPVQGINLVTAFGKRSKSIKLQLLIEFNIEDEDFEVVFLVAPQLNCDVILGCNFLKEYGIQLCFDTERINYVRQGEVKSFRFEIIDDKVDQEVQNVEVRNGVLEKNYGSDLVEARTTEDQFEEVETGCAYAADYGAGRDVLARRDCMQPERRGQRGDTVKKEGNDITYAAPSCNQVQVKSKTRYPAEARAGSLLQEINQSCKLDAKQKLQLFEILKKYLSNFTERPGKCHLLKYRFQVKADQPLRSFSRPVPFAMRNAVKTQIMEMIHDDILELSQSDVLNPLTIVPREGKKPRICVDARKVNQYTIPDYERTPPLQELLQRFEGAKFISSIDLNSAFLQVELHEDSRKYTAFFYDSVVYQYKRVPYGFKNSLPAFMRALRLALGEGNESFVLAYVDDILVYSRTFEEHLKHLDIVIGKLTQAGFTINIAKCKFCIKEIKFLGHVISPTGVAADPTRIDAILNYPSPKNQKQLRQFLGTCNFHNRFIVKYSEFVAPLLPLLKKGIKWAWTQEKEQAFQNLRNSFAKSIQLAHPREDLPYEIHTDASKVGISAHPQSKG
jgi:hypothetical protein